MAVMTVSWKQLFQEIEACRKCPLRDGCKNVVPGEGYPLADVMLIGEGPGAEEDRTGRPFVGRAGELLTQMLHDNGIEVNVWTVDTIEEAQRVTDCGVDYITSNILE